MSSNVLVLSCDCHGTVMGVLSTALNELRATKKSLGMFSDRRCGKFECFVNKRSGSKATYLERRGQMFENGYTIYVKQSKR